MSQLSLYLLGPPRIERDGEPIEVDTRKAVALLAYLALTAESHARDALVNLLWPESDPAHGRAALRRTLYALRRALAGSPQRFDPAAWLDVDWETIGLAPQVEFWSDVDQFHRLLAQCRTHGHPASDLCPECVPLLTAAVELHRGDFLSGFSLKDSYAFDDWQFFQAESLRRELADALDRLVRAHTVLAVFEPAIRYARQSLALDRLNETAHCQLMRLYAWSGQRTAALRQYRECVRVLETQLGTAPQASTTELYKVIAANHLAPPAAVPVPPSVQPLQTLDSSSALPSPASEQGKPPLTRAAARYEAKRLVTVLAADLDVSSSGEGGSRAEDEADRIERLLALVRDATATYGALVEPTLAGRTLALFGAERTRENDPELAIRAAIEARDAAEKLGLRLAVGICTGEAYLKLAGLMLPERIWVGRAIAQATHLAELAQDGSILAAESTYYLTRQAFAFTPCVLNSEGDVRPVRVYKVDHLLARARKAWGLEGLRAQLIGRDEELARLRHALALALAGQGQVVSLIGEAGVGKTRLVAELRESVPVSDDPGSDSFGSVTGSESAKTPLWLEGRCLELGSSVGYALFADILRQYFAWDMREAESRRFERLLACLHRMGERGDLKPEQAEETAATLGHLLALPVGDVWEERLAHEDPQQLRSRRSLALRDFLVALCSQRPVVLGLEDLHWADSLSVELIAMLMGELPRTPLLLLCVYRPEREHRCWHLATIAAQKCRDAYTEIVLDELTHEESRLMLHSLLGAGLSPAVEDLILSQAQGNPFYTEEVVHTLIDGGMLCQEGESWQAREDAALAAIPGSVQSVILSRVEALEGRLIEVLHVSAVIGRVFRQRVLANALTQDIELQRVLWELEDRALIYQERSVPEVEYSFKHVLTQQTVLQSIPLGRRQQLHLQVAGSIETLYGDSLDEYDEQLAHHYEQAGDPEKAMTYLLLAAGKARGTHANEEAIAHYGRALQLLQAMRATPERDQRELDLRILLGTPLLYTRGHSGAEMETNYARAYELCERVGTPAQRSQVMLGLRRFHFCRGELLKAYPLAERFLALAQEADDPIHLAFAYPAVGEILYWLGDFTRCQEYCERGLRIYDPARHAVYLSTHGNDPGVGCWFLGGMAAWHLGYPDRALVMSQSAVDQAQAEPHPFVQAMALYHHGVVHRLRREPGMARAQMEVLLSISGERRFGLYHAWGSVLHGWALAQGSPAGQSEQGIEEIRTGIAALRSMGAAVSLPSSLAGLAECCLQSGKLVEAASALDEALSQVAACGESSWKAELHRLKGELLVRQGDDRSAEGSFHQAIDTARGQKARSWELRAATSLGRLWHRLGKPTDARRLLQPVYGTFTQGFNTLDLQEASTLLRELGAPFSDSMNS